MRPVGLAALLAAVVGCAASTSGPRTVQALRYDVRLAGLGPCLLDVDIDMKGEVPVLEGVEPAGLVSLSVTDARGKRSPTPREGTVEVDCHGACRVTYRYDLSAAADAATWYSVAVERGKDMLAPARTWLLRPSRIEAGLPVSLGVAVPEGARFVTGLRRAEGEEGFRYALFSEELGALGLTAFGRFEPFVVPVTGAEVEVAVLQGERVATNELLQRWVKQSARVLDQVYGRFPVRRAAVFVVPGRGDDVNGGMMFASGGASVMVSLGQGAGERALLAEDWVLPHELFHLGAPSFGSDGTWLKEGLATYYEPLARARARVTEPPAPWLEFFREMPRGVGVSGALAEARDIDRMYWGGAVFSFRADIEIRRRSRGAHSLDDGLRRALELGGDATARWSLDRYFKILDEATGTTTLRELYAEARSRSSQDEQALREVFQLLGISMGPSGLRFSDEAPLAAIRRDLLTAH